MIFLAAAIGVGIGIVVGALGAGGGILSVPVLVYLLGFAPHNATAASLIIVLFTAVVALRHPIRHGNVAWREGLMFGAIAIAGSAVSSRASLLIPEHLLMTGFGSLLLAVSLVMFRRAAHTRREEVAHAEPTPTGEGPERGEPEMTAATRNPARPEQQSPGAEQKPTPAHPVHSLGAAPSPGRPQGRQLLTLIAAAAVTGALTGFFGVGGGFLAVPMLMIAAQLPMRRATGTSLIVMIMSSLSALAARIGTPTEIDFAAVALFALGSSIGGALGGPLSAKARPSTLTYCFAALLCVLGTFTLVRTLIL